MAIQLLLLFSALSKMVSTSSDVDFLNETIEEVTMVVESSTVLHPMTSSVSSRLRPVDLHCPSIENAVSTCPKDTSWVYYTCCGGANMYCCEHIQTWLLSVLAMVAVFLALVLLACCVRCCCSYSNPPRVLSSESNRMIAERKTQQSYNFDDK